MKNFGKDKFEQFFQNSLKGYQEDPADDFWEKMEGEIPPPPAISFWKKYGKLGGALLMSGVVVLVVWQWWKYENDLNQIQASLTLQNEKIENVEKQLTQLENQNIELTSKDLESKSRIGESISFGKNNNVGVTHSQDRQVKNQIKQNAKNDIDFNSTTLQKTFLNDEPTSTEFSFLEKNKKTKSTQDELLLSKDENSNFEKIALVQDLETLKTSAIFSNELAIEDVFPEWELFVERRKKGFEIYGNFSRILPQMKVKEIGLVAEREKAFDLEIGTLFHFPIHKNWSIQLGMGYGENTIQSSIQKDFVYDANEVFVSNEIAQTTYRYNLTTNYYGPIIVDAFLHQNKENDGQDLTAGDPFSMDLIYTKRQRYFFLPLFFKFYWDENVSPLDWNFRMGVVQCFAYLENENEVGVSENFSNPRLEEHITFVNIKGTAPQKRMDTSVILGVGFEYHLSRYCTLSFETNYKQTLAYHGKIRPATLGIYTGVRWNFFE